MSTVERGVLVAVFVLYCAATAFGALVHEPWWDEIQAWLIARDASVGELLTRQAAYEGHPPLWHLLLMVPAKLGLPFGSMKVLAWLAGVFGVWLLLFRFPRVPLLLRVLAPFTLFVCYQFVVVARSYILMLPILLGIALLYERRGELPFAVLLVLLANVSVHGFAMACALAALVVVDAIRGRRRVSAAGLALFVANAVFLVWVLWPRRDLTSAVALHPFSVGRVLDVILRIPRELLWGPTEAPALLVGITTVAFFAIMLVWFARSGVLPVYLLITAAMLPIVVRYYAQWHQGLFFYTLLFAITRTSVRNRFDRIAVLVAALFLLRHVQWTASSLQYDARYEYTGSERAAQFLADNGLQRRRMAGLGFRAMEIQPYFASNVFANWKRNEAFWDFSPRNGWPLSQGTPESRAAMGRFYAETMLEAPEVIVLGLGYGDDDLYRRALERDPRYRRIAVFPGRAYWKNSLSTWGVFEIWEKANRLTGPDRLPPSGRR